MLSRLLTDNIFALFPVNSGEKMVVAFVLLLKAGIFNLASFTIKIAA